MLANVQHVHGVKALLLELLIRVQQFIPWSRRIVPVFAWYVTMRTLQHGCYGRFCVALLSLFTFFSRPRRCSAERITQPVWGTFLESTTHGILGSHRVRGRLYGVNYCVV